jgi:DNA-binding PadR family transcriptional regulator
VLIVDHGSLYPALQRLEKRRFISAKWGTSENNRRARFYTLTPKGRRELTPRADRVAPHRRGHHAHPRAGRDMTSAIGKLVTWSIGN